MAFHCDRCGWDFQGGREDEKKHWRTHGSTPYSDYAINLFMSELSQASPEAKQKLKRMLRDLLDPEHKG